MANQYQGKQAIFRCLFVLVFWLIFYCAQLVTGFVALAQCVFVAFTGSANLRLMQFGESIGKYIQQIIQYVTFNSDQRPFPFDEFPKSDLVVDA